MDGGGEGDAEAMSDERKPRRIRWKKKTVHAWGGFVDGELYHEFANPDYGGQLLPAIYRTRTEALQAFQDVRLVEISWKETRR